MITHHAVMLQEAVDALVTQPQGSYVDCTYGRGGHSQAIADRLNEKGRLLVIDKDEAAIEDATRRFAGDPRVSVIHGSFSQIAEHVKACQMQPLNGALLDLGVSSPQLDQAERGFSFSVDGPLDMRMDQSTGETVAEWLVDADEEEITVVLKKFGEERFARRIARKILEVRQSQPINRTGALVEIIDSAIPRKEKHKHPATRSFQAFRIHINRELQDLEDCLEDVVELLASGGRLVVISFHSLEDRIVKRFFREKQRGPQLPRRLPVRDVDIVRSMRNVGKAVRASDAEIQSNRRARSSIMRIAEKT